MGVQKILFHSFFVYTDPVSVHLFIVRTEPFLLLTKTQYISLHHLVCLLKKSEGIWNKWYTFYLISI